MKLLNNAVIRLTKNRKPAYDPENELMWDRTYNSSSWFVIGHFEAEGHKLELFISPDGMGKTRTVP
mgnify:CR=1 FL=1